ncbi:NAD(P)/FAD-dependent oxidoreductase [Sphingomonas phyllosphaerae]|uniref:NAD(P)/FAD-dependent oxidoreductase n=1 Tax=Sphingomonas phyllosphaerae TaxID=257003 RepID=UPI00241351B8|nr:FAD-dependent oxidoreductase [Sphingomonas phyllosphaerae]
MNDGERDEGERYDVVIVGAGHGGAAAAAALRQRGFAGSIVLIGAEPELPYERPPLSKEYLAGERAFERMLIRPAAFWREREITLLLGQPVAVVDASARRVTLENGRVIGYHRLIWAAGGSARRLACEGHDLAGVHTVRCRADVDRMIAELPRVERVAVVGGGYVGLEAAAVLTALGRRVTVIEARDRLLARVAGATLADFYAAEHRARGVEVRLGAQVESILANDGVAAGVRLGDGERVAAEMVIVGIGLVPAVAPLLAAGADGGDGVIVDSLCRTSLPDVYAIGDAAAHRNAFAGGALVRLESVQNATDQAATVAKRLTGTDEPYAAVPWFWSNQYDLRLQTVGLSAGHDEAILRGAPTSRRFSVIYRRAGRVVALDCVNAARDFVRGKALVSAGATVDATVLADPAIPL